MPQPASKKPLEMLSRSPFLSCLCCLVLFAIHLGLLVTPYLDRFENMALDHFLKRRHPLKSNNSIVFFEISDRTLDLLGRWPWPRSYLVPAIHLLGEWQAKAVVLDLIFSRPSSSVEQDSILSESFRNNGRVYIPLYLEINPSTRKWIVPIPPLADEAKGMGLVNITPDFDGIVRRIPARLEHGEVSYPHLALRVAFDALAQDGVSYSQQLPLDSKGNLLINWTGKWGRAFDHYRYEDLWYSFKALRDGQDPLISREKIRGKICLIGITATGFADIKATPLQPAYPGLGILADTINSILAQKFITPASFRLNALCLLGILLLSAILFFPFRKIFSALGGLLLLFLWVQFAFFLFEQNGLRVNVVTPSLLIFSLFLCSTVRFLVTESQEKTRFFALATRDGRTGLYLMRHFQTILDHVVLQAHKEKKPLSLILMDLDHFKEVNDQYGHLAGNLVLEQTAEIIRSNTRSISSGREQDMAARYGGEEFLVLLDGANTAASLVVGERLRQAIEKSQYLWKNQRISVSVSIGTATLRPEETTPAFLVERADQALYRAKQEGRNRVCTADEVGG